jgi:uncharacterized membrane protein YccC
VLTVPAAIYLFCSWELVMRVIAGYNRPAIEFHNYGVRLRFCLRMTVAAVSAFAVAQILTVPLHGLWAVLTAVVVTQMSVGGSLRSTAEYVIGTLGGAIYASAVGLLVPHATPAALAGVLAVAVAPLAYAAALSPMFRVAPFTAVIVLLISSEMGEGPIEAGLYRLLEVAIGGAVAVMVSLLLLPDRAHRLGLDTAARVLDQLARILTELLAGFSRKVDVVEVGRAQDEIGQLVAAFDAVAAEARRERMVNLLAEPDPAPLYRTLLRLRHDLVIIGRASVLPLPEVLAQRLGPLLKQMADSASDFLNKCASALVARGSAPRLDLVETALEAYNREFAVVRNEGLTGALSSHEVEPIFTLGFALEQLHQHFLDLARCVDEWAGPSRPA